MADLQQELETFLSSRWPAASTAAIAKLVETECPDVDQAGFALGSRNIQIEPEPAPTSSRAPWSMFSVVAIVLLAGIAASAWAIRRTENLPTAALVR